MFSTYPHRNKTLLVQTVSHCTLLRFLHWFQFLRFDLAQGFQGAGHFWPPPPMPPPSPPPPLPPPPPAPTKKIMSAGIPMVGHGSFSSAPGKQGEWKPGSSLHFGNSAPPTSAEYNFKSTNSAATGIPTSSRFQVLVDAFYRYFIAT